jgi:uncharacterized protein
MVARATFEQIPEYASEEVANKILELTIESEPLISPVKCEEYLIRHWCETVEDGNPLYLDEEYAKSMGFRGPVAQPGMIICTLYLPYRWPWPPPNYAEERNIHEQLKALLGKPFGILANREVEFHEHVQIGDQLNTTDSLLAISPLKKTRLGLGHFWTAQRTFRNQELQLVARQITTYYGFAREG